MGIRIGSKRDKFLCYENAGAEGDNACCAACGETWIGPMNEKHKPSCPCYAEWQADIKLPSQ